ncbi:MAG TPA: ABC transporter permease [Gemmatimonadaceae bacterium]
MRRNPSSERPEHPEDVRPAPNSRLAKMLRRYVHFWGPRADVDVDDELAFHMDMRIDDHLARGMTDAEARDAVARRVGNLTAVRAQCINIDSRRNRRMTRAQLIDSFVQDVRFGVRTLRRQKGWTAVGILTLALGIGANTAVFSVIDTLVLHPLAYPDASRLAVVFLQPTQSGGASGVSVYLTPDSKTAKAWQTNARSFDDLEGFASGDMIMRRGTDQASVVHGASVQPGFAALAGQRPIVGRFFTLADRKSKSKVAVLGEGIWRARFGGDRGAVGQSIGLDGALYTIIGVMPAAFQLPAVL